MTDLIKRLREADSYNKKYYALDPLHQEAADRIEALTESNKELTLQLLATHGQAADVLDKAVVAEAKLAKAGIIALETILHERGLVFDAMVDAAEDAAGKDVSFNVVIGRAIRAALAVLAALEK